MHLGLRVLTVSKVFSVFKVCKVFKVQIGFGVAGMKEQGIQGLGIMV